MTYKFDKSGKLQEPADAELAAAPDSSHIIVIDKGVLDDGRPYWAYVAVKTKKYKAYLRAVKAQKPMKLKEYGDILKSGVGKTVPQLIRDEMKEKYGCDDNYIETLKQNVRKAQNTFFKQQEDKKIGDIVAMMKMKQMGKK